jgi:hypothetical protein
MPSGYLTMSRARQGDDVSGMTAQPTMSRRVMVVGAASAAALAVPFAKSIFSAVLPRPPILGAVFDSRFPQSRDFAERARSLGIGALGFAVDMSKLWFGELLPALRAASQHIVGLTSSRALFCFERLAWDIGMRVRLRIEHLENGYGFRHSSGGDLPSPLLTMLAAANGAFGRRALDVVLCSHAAWGNCTYATVPQLPGFRGEPLVTWVIAPVRSP